MAKPVPGHHLRVARGRDQKRRRVYWQAHCECGWHGRRRPLRGEAASDASMHKLEMAQVELVSANEYEFRAAFDPHFVPAEDDPGWVT